MSDAGLVLLEVQKEYAEVAIRTEKLRRFLEAFKAAVKATKRTDKSLAKAGWRFDGVTLSHCTLLTQQYGVMDMYKNTLAARLVAISKEINARSKAMAKSKKKAKK